MPKILIDTNVILDVLLDREPWVEDAADLWFKVESGVIEGWVAATTLTNIFYITRKQNQSLDLAKQAISEVMNVMRIARVDRTVLERAIETDFQDFEDAVQFVCAIATGLDTIVTRDPGDFEPSTLPVLSPRELLDRLS